MSPRRSWRPTTSAKPDAQRGAIELRLGREAEMPARSVCRGRWGASLVDFPLYAGKSDHDGASGGLIRHGLTEADVTTHWGLRATTAARTLTDLTHALDPRLPYPPSKRRAPQPPSQPRRPAAEAATKPTDETDPVGVRGRVPQLLRPPPPPPATDQRDRGRLRGRRLLARPAADRRTRRRGVPRGLRSRPRLGDRTDQLAERRQRGFGQHDVAAERPVLEPRVEAAGQPAGVGEHA